MTIKLPKPLYYLMVLLLAYAMGQRLDEMVLGLVALGMLCYGIDTGCSEPEGR